MTVALVGGRTKLKSRYQEAAKKQNIDLKIFMDKNPCLGCKLSGADGVIMLTDLVSHQSAKEVYKLARRRDFSLICSHKSSPSAFGRCLEDIRKVAGDK